MATAIGVTANITIVITTITIIITTITAGDTAATMIAGVEIAAIAAANTATAG